MQLNIGVLLSLWGFNQPTLDLAKDNQQRQVPNSWRYISISNFRWLEFIHFGVVLRIGIYMDLYSYQSQVLLLDQHQDPKLLFSDTYIIGLQKNPCKKKKNKTYPWNQWLQSTIILQFSHPTIFPMSLLFVSRHIHSYPQDLPICFMGIQPRKSDSPKESQK